MQSIIVIGGAGGSGKSTLAQQRAVQLGGRIRSSDDPDIRALPWPEQSTVLAREMLAAGPTRPLVFEGVRVLSALRKVLDRPRAPYELEHFEAVFLHGSFRSLSGQAAVLAKRIAQQWSALRPRLQLNGVTVNERSATTGVTIY